MIIDHYDIVIVGGGPVGMALALSLRDSGVSSLLLEARGLPEKDEDPRPLALSHGSYLILQRLEVWDRLIKNTPIQTIHISNRGSFGRTILESQDAGVPALGYVVNYHDLFSAMHAQLTTSESNYITGALVTRINTTESSGNVFFDHNEEPKQVTAKLLVLADGGQLIKQIPDINYRSYDYQQWAVVANIRAEKKQTGIAYERFTPDGPVALLPNNQDFSLVWTVAPDIVKEITELNDKSFLFQLHQHFGDRLGKFIGAGKRSAFPLALKYATSTVSQRIALVGNAAQTLHPVAGQGFNLGLRDAYELACEIIHANNASQELGTPTMLSKYLQRRRKDSNAVRTFTDTLVKLFSNDSKILNQACGFGLSTLDCVPPLKRFIARRMIFGAKE